MGELNIQANQFIPPGSQALVRNGEVVCTCRIGDPIEDAEIDSIVMHPSDIEQATTAAEEHIGGTGRRGMNFLIAAAILAALLSGIALAALADEKPRAEKPHEKQPPFTLDDHKAAIDSFYIAGTVLKERCREMTDAPATCLAKGEVAMLERVRKACEDAHGSTELCGEIADAKRY